MSKTLVAVQVYSVQEEAQNDFYGTMKKIKEFGYDGIELAGLYNLTPAKIKEIITEVDLNPIAAHVPYEALRDDLEGTLEAYKTIGCKYIVIPYLAEEDRYGNEGYDKFIEDISTISKACAERGLELLYHNHEFEFEKDDSGNYVLDSLFGSFDKDELGAEIDVGWVTVSNEDPVNYIDKHKDRTKLVHIKDCLSKEPPRFTHAGSGIVDVKGVVEKSKEINVRWLVVEVDGETKTLPLDNIRLSIDYLRSILD